MSRDHRVLYIIVMKKRANAIPRNLGTADRILRAAAAGGIALLWYFNVITGWWAAILMAMGGALLLNSLLGRCGLYAALGLSTCKIPAPPAADKNIP